VSPPVKPKISIVMPVYNGGHYFAQAVDSALAQTYPDIEIVMVNDGSTDGGQTDAICRRYAEAHPDKIRYVLQENCGVGGALNAGLKAMTGDVFCWLSHDDLFEPHKTERQVAFFRQLDRPDAMLISDYRLIGPDDKIIRDIRLDHSTLLANPRLPLFGGWINGCTIFIPRHLLPGDAPFKTHYRHVQDYRLWLELVRDHEFFHQPEMLVRYRIHPGQDSHKPEAVVEGQELWIDMAESCGAAVKAQLGGSTWRFYDQMAHEAYPVARAHSRAKRDASIASSLVSVLIRPGGAPDAAAALASVQAQSHSQLDILVADAPGGSLAAAAAGDPRVRFAGPGDLQGALLQTRGEYVALLDGADTFQRDKIARQVEAMQIAGAHLSHTSYSRRAADGFERIDAGRLGGRLAAGTVAAAPPTVSTVMLHRLLIAEGLTLAADLGGSGPWIDACRRRPLLGLDDALTVQGGAGRAAPAQEPKPVFDPEFFLGQAEPDRSFSGIIGGLLTHADMLGVPRPGWDVDISPVSWRYKNPLPVDPVQDGVPFSSGATPWDYVAAFSLDPEAVAQSSHLQLVVQTAEQAYAMIVDADYNPIGRRQPLDPGPVPAILMFELDGAKPAAVVVQAGAQPREAPLRVRRVRLFAPLALGAGEAG
jgi:hypothetical protein